MGIFSDKKFSKLAEFLLDLIYQNKIYNAFDIPSLRLQICFKLVAVIYLEVCGFLCYGSWKLPSQIIYIVDVYIFFCSSLWQLYFKIYFVEVFYNHSFEIALFVEAFDNPYFEILIFIEVFYNPFLGLYTSLKLFTISPWDNISHWSIIKILQYLKIIYLIEAFNTLTLR